MCPTSPGRVPSPAVFHISPIFQPLISLFSGQTASYDKNNHIFEIYIENRTFSKTVVKGTFREVVSDYNYCFLSNY